ncbi:DNA-3-methyladenine glycosylase II [Saccharomyces paradoxus]|uniref:DNA-3-methyladenine glycosylase II n=1 Tax=Saccharomyces paradoxus TaxID=27291 RepID=A0A8B8UQA5_SACPA|nr:Mag1 [Saccharomyces paradoxus]QHS72928.1 Mag1 [Saccharomyces paradoxus]
MKLKRGYDELIKADGVKEIVKELGSSSLDVALPEEYIARHEEKFNMACEYILEKDPSLFPLLKNNEFTLYLKETQVPDTLEEYFIRLASTILSQQISGLAAKSIKARVVSLYGGAFPDYKVLFEDFKDPVKSAKIAKCGLSKRKMIYLESLAAYFTERYKDVEKLFSQEDNDEEVINSLVTNVKGIGPWSAKMFLISGLKRMDVFAPEDLGIARGFSKYLSDKPELEKELMRERKVVKKSKIKHKKYNWKIYDDDVMEKCSEIFAPYRSVFMFILWRLSSTDTEAMMKAEKDFVKS